MSEFEVEPPERKQENMNSRRIVSLFQRATSGTKDDPEVTSSRRIIKGKVDSGEIHDTWYTKGKESWIEAYSRTNQNMDPRDQMASQRFINNVNFAEPLGSTENLAALENLYPKSDDIEQYPDIPYNFSTSRPGPGYRMVFKGEGLDSKRSHWRWTHEAYKEDTDRSK